MAARYSPGRTYIHEHLRLADDFSFVAINQYGSAFIKANTDEIRIGQDSGKESVMPVSLKSVMAYKADESGLELDIGRTIA